MIGLVQRQGGAGCWAVAVAAAIYDDQTYLIGHDYDD